MSEYQNLLAQIAELQRKASEIRDAERKAAIEQIKSLMLSFSINKSELPDNIQSASAKKTTPKIKNKASVKYQDTKGNQWSGRGLQPKWLRAELESGKTLESFLIASK